MLITRRTILGAAGAAAVLPVTPRARAAGPLKVAYVYVSPIGDAGWTYQHELGRRALDAAMGDKVKTSFVENVSEGADAERVIRKLAQDGNELIFTTSFGYMNPTAKVAEAFPKLKFEHCTGYKRSANLATYSARFYEPRYLTGVLAGRMSKTGTIGYVAAFPIPEVIQGINAVLLGARTVNPAMTAKVVFTSSWFDPGKERAAADTLMAQGADILMQHTDSTAVVQAGEEKGVWTCGYDSDMSKYGPKTCMTAVTMVWDQYYIDRAKAAIDGTWKSTDTWGGIGAGMVKLAPLNKGLPAPVTAEVEARSADIASGKLHPFAGPISDQSGAVKVAAGAKLADKDILSMNWFVDGVQGKV
jgi:simple sugar transport system substrate-binding protein